MPFIYVVSRDRRDLYERLKADFMGRDEVRVVLDRRRGQRRRQQVFQRVNLRRGDRRTRRELDTELRSTGAFLTEAEGLVLLEVR